MDKDKLIEQAKSLAAAMFDPLGNGESDNMIMSNRDAQNAAEIIYGLIALLEDDNPPWTAKDFATAVPFQEIVKMHLSKQAEQEPVAWIDLTEQDKWSAYCDHMPPTKNRKLVFDAGISAGIKFFKEKNAAPVKTICYQEVYDALEAQLIKEPTGNGLDQVAQNNGLVMAMNTLQHLLNKEKNRG